MNERMVELYKEAAEFAYEMCKSEGRTGGVSDHIWNTLSTGKFAELIVRECANHCDLLLDHKISSEWSRGTHDCSRAIKKHFGVEE